MTKIKTHCGVGDLHSLDWEGFNFMCFILKLPRFEVFTGATSERNNQKLGDIFDLWLTCSSSVFLFYWKVT